MFQRSSNLLDFGEMAKIYALRHFNGSPKLPVSSSFITVNLEILPVPISSNIKVSS